MKKELFDELLKSVKQGGAIMKRTMKPARTFTFGYAENGLYSVPGLTFISIRNC